MSSELAQETDLAIGPSAIDAYSRLSYTMWYAFAEFIDNSTQSRSNYDSIIDQVLKDEGQPLIVQIDHDRVQKTITIQDNSIGMTLDDLVAALRIAYPTKDSKGRSKYGMGMKTAACWIGKHWTVVTAEWGSGKEYTAHVDVEGIAHEGKKIPITVRDVSTDAHYTKIVISKLHRNIQKRTEETIRSYLGSMYRFDLKNKTLTLLYNDQEIKTPDDYEFDTDPEGKIMRAEIPSTTINGRTVSGWFGVLRKGGRKFGGFSLFQNQRQIQGFPNAWKPNSIFGGVDDEGANNLVSQRLTGAIELDGFKVSHTKDAILFEGDEEQELEELLVKLTNDYRKYAQKRRGTKGQPWSKEKIKDLLDSMKKEFENPELKDAVDHTVLPPIETILANNKQQLAMLSPEDTIGTVEVSPELKVIVSVQEKSEYEPYVTIVAGAEPGTIHVIINRLHPYYASQDVTEAVEECMRQYVYDALAEYKVSKQSAKVMPESVRRLKDSLLRAHVVQIENAAADTQEAASEPTT